MKREERLKRRSHLRDCSKQHYTIAPDAHRSMRSILDRIARGQNISEMPREHHVLPPDGEDLEDFDTGTDEIIDIADAQRIAEEVESKMEKFRKDKEDAEKAQKEADFEARVQEALASRLSKERSDDDVTK